MVGESSRLEPGSGAINSCSCKPCLGFHGGDAVAGHCTPGEVVHEAGSQTQGTRRCATGPRPQVAPAGLSHVPSHCALVVHRGMLSLRTCKGTSHGVEGPSPSTNGDPKPVVHRQGSLHRTAGTAEPSRSDPSLTSKVIPDSHPDPHPDPSPNAPCKSTSPGLLWRPGARPRRRGHGSVPQGHAAAASQPLQMPSASA